MTFDDEINEYLEHHGVKGQKWGVRREREIVSESNAKSVDASSPVQKALKEHPQPKLTTEQKRQLAINQEKHDSHFDPSEDPDPKGWRPTKKQVAIAAVGAVAAAGIAAGVVYKVKTGNKAFSAEDYMKAARSAETPGWISEFGGRHMSPTDYKGIIGNSTGRIWTGQHITKESFARPPMEFGKGHQFFRISQRKESSFGGHTYCVPSEADFARYLHTFTGAAHRDAHLITFKATDTIKIPDMHTQLEAYRQVLVGEGHKGLKPADVIRRFSHLSGGGWESTPRGKSFINILQAQGFHGIIDEMDAGVYGESPLVLFDSSRLGPKAATLLTSINPKPFVDMLTDIPNRR